MLFSFQGVSLTVKVRRKIKKKAALMRVVGVPLPVKNQLTVNQTAKKVLQRKHVELSMKGRYMFVWFLIFCDTSFKIALPVSGLPSL